MRHAAALILVCLALSAPASQLRSEPFVPVGVWYGGGTARAPMVDRDPGKAREAWRRDLATIRALGFNSVKTWVDWASGEPERGRYRFDALDQILTLADEVGLKVIIQVYTDAAPEWLGRRYPDASFVTDQGVRIGSQASPGYCLDHAGVRADMVAFPRASRVAIMYNRLSYMVGGTVGGSTAGGNTVAPGATVRQSMIGMYRALFEQNIQADFIHADEIVAGLASKYDVIILSYPLMLPDPAAQMLKGYVREGGTLISEARPAWNDERGYANLRIPGFGLDEVFGAREKELRSPDPVSFVAEPGLEGPLAPLSGRTFNATGFAEHLEVTGASARVVARFPADGAAAGSGGDPAIITNRYGSGRAILIGGFPSAAFEQDPVKWRAAGELLQGLVASAGVAPDVRIQGAPGLVEARFLESADALLLIAINHAETPQKVTLSFSADTPEAIWQNMETGAAVSFVQGSAGPTYTHAFAPRDVMVLVRGKRLR